MLQVSQITFRQIKQPTALLICHDRDPAGGGLCRLRPVLYRQKNDRQLTQGLIREAI